MKFKRIALRFAGTIFCLIVFILCMSLAFAEEVKFENWTNQQELIKALTDKAEEIQAALKNIAYLLVALFSFVALAIGWFKFYFMKGFDFYQIVPRIFIVLVLLTAYSFIVNTVYSLTDSVNNTIYKGSIMDSVSDILAKRMEEEQKLKDEPWWRKAKNIVSNLDVRILEYGATMGGTFLSWCITVMGFIRLFAICFLYAVGVLAIPWIIFSGGTQVAKAWWMSLLAVSFWPLVWKIMFLFFSAFQPKDVIGGSAFVLVGLYYITVGCLIIWTPKLVSAFARGVGIGETMSFAGVTAMAFAKGAVMKGVGGAAKQYDNWKTSRGITRERRRQGIIQGIKKRMAKRGIDVQPGDIQ